MVIKKYCSEEWCAYLDNFSQIVEVPAGNLIFSVGDDTQGLFVILDGKVKVTTNVGNKVERVIRLAANDDILGHRGFGGTWKYSVSASALVDSKLMFIPLKIFNQVFKANPEFAYFMMVFFADELRDSEDLATQLPIRNTIASVLLKNVETFGFEKGSTTKLSYNLNRKDLASLAGTRYETLVRTLAEFNAESLIKIDGKAIHILDVKRLQKLKEGQI